MTRTGWSRVGGVAVGVVGGAVVGALVFAPLSSLAQDDSTTPSQSQAPAQEDGDRGPGGHGPGPHGVMMGEGLETAAEALGVTEDDLRAALADGQSIADVAEEQGVDLQGVVDALVAAATERIDDAVDDGRLDEDRAAELKEELPDRVAAMVEREGFAGRHGGMGRGGPGPCMDDEDDEGSGVESSGSGTASTTAGVDTTGTVLVAV